eukprot:3864870-Prymnesium_polylepis.1
MGRLDSISYLDCDGTPGLCANSHHLLNALGGLDGPGTWAAIPAGDDTAGTHDQGGGRRARAADSGGLFFYWPARDADSGAAGDDGGAAGLDGAVWA